MKDIKTTAASTDEQERSEYKPPRLTPIDQIGRTKVLTKAFTDTTERSAHVFSMRRFYNPS